MEICNRMEYKKNILLYKNIIIAASEDLSIYAIDSTVGKEIWRCNTERKILKKFIIRPSDSR